MDGAPGGENCLGVRLRQLSGACRNRAQIWLHALPGPVRPILGVSKYWHQRSATKLSSNTPVHIWQTGRNSIDQRAFPRGQACRHYLIYPGIHIQHRSALSDRNCGATTTRAAMCIHCYSIEFAIGETDGYAPVQNDLIILAPIRARLCLSRNDYIFKMKDLAKFSGTGGIPLQIRPLSAFLEVIP